MGGHTTEDVMVTKQLNFIDIEIGNELYATDGLIHIVIRMQSLL